MKFAKLGGRSRLRPRTGVITRSMIVGGIAFWLSGLLLLAGSGVASAQTLSTIQLTGGLSQQPCPDGWFFVVTPVSQTQFVTITLTMSNGTVLTDVAFQPGPQDGQATVANPTGLDTIVSGSATAYGLTATSQFNLSHCATGGFPPPSYSVTTLDSASNAAPGDTISDTAQISVTNASTIPSGTLTFNLYDNPNCSGSPLNTPGSGVDFAGSSSTPSVYVPTSPVAADSYTIPSSLSTSTDYYWVATYTASGVSVTSGCAAEEVAVTVTPPSPNSANVYTVQSAGGPVGTRLSDTAYVTGISDPTSGDSVTFGLYSDSSCSILVHAFGNGSLSGPTRVSGVATWMATSPGSGYAPSVAQTYYWGVMFNSVGDSANRSSSLVCGEPVTITAPTGAVKGAHTTKPKSHPSGAVLGASTPGTGADLFQPGLAAALAFLFGAVLLATAERLRRRPAR